LLVAGYANILWKKVQRDELLKEEALLAARLLQGAEIELLPMRSLFETAARMSIEIDHPVYDFVYLALAAESKCKFVTAYEGFLRKLYQGQLPLRLTEHQPSVRVTGYPTGYLWPRHWRQERRRRWRRL
jgi:hypothetical protein